MIRHPLAISSRGGRIDALHYGSIAVTTAGGELLHAVNDPNYPTYLRSSIKTIQALPVILSGAAERFGFTDEELALCCASHIGSARHVEVVASMLEKMGLEESALRCGPHEPDDPDERRRAICGSGPSQLHNNCSGKHAGMLGVCLVEGWPLESYISIEHPLQQWIYELMAEYSGIGREMIGIGIDGCSLPAFYMPISGAATIIARYMQKSEEAMTADARLLRACVAHPDMVNGEGGFDTELIRAGGGTIFAKRGAMAMFLIGLQSEEHGPVGIALKLEDGNMTPMPPVAMRALTQLGYLTDEMVAALASFQQVILKNWRGVEIGMISADFELTGVPAA